MKEKIIRFFKTKQAKIGLALVCIVAVLTAAFLLQPTPNRSAQVANALIASSDESHGSSASSSTPSSSTDGSLVDPSTNNSTSSENEVNTSHQTPSSSTSGMEINPETGKDKYQTDPVPEGKPTPVEPENITVDKSKQYTCTLSIRCDTILNNMDMLKEEKKSMVPANGVILGTTTVTFNEGESVFDVLKRVTRQKRIHIEFENTPIYNSAYIEGINNLYEFDCGDLSGWMYKVNGWFPNYGCSRYHLKQGDVIEWVYTCDLGYDVGGGYSTGQASVG